MFSLLENLLAARRRPKEGAWIEFAIIAAIIGFSIIKTFLRARSAASKKEPEETVSRPKPRPAAGRYKSDNSYKTLQQLREERKSQIRAAFGIPTPPGKEKPAAKPLPAPPQPAKKIEKPVRHAKAVRPSADFAPVPQKVYAETLPSRISAKRISKKQPHVPVSSRTDTDDAYQPLFSSPQDLRTAILYYEILGKPVSLRDAV